MSTVVTNGRITLTKGQAESVFGQRLINQILAMSHDGDITLEEVWQLHGILKEGPQHIAAVPFLRAITTGILSDGQLDACEAYELRRGMERAVPKSVRLRVTELLASIGMPSTYDDQDVPHAARQWRNDPVTERQIEYLAALGAQPTRDMTKGEASDLIEEYRVVRPPTPRQRMLLRFYDRCDLEKVTKEEVSLFIDGLYIKHPDYERAWHLYKADVGHDNNSLDYLSVPIGAYRKYLRQRARDADVRGGRATAETSKRSRLLAWFLLLVGVGILVMLILIALK